MATNEEKIAILEEEVNLLTSRIQPAGTGYLYTTIDTIKGRIAELREEIEKSRTTSETMQDELEPIPPRYPPKAALSPFEYIQKINENLELEKYDN